MSQVLSPTQLKVVQPGDGDSGMLAPGFGGTMAPFLQPGTATTAKDIPVGDGTLADGQCLDVATLVNAPPSECAEGFAEARRAEEISSLVLEHDLQQRISDKLAETLQ